MRRQLATALVLTLVVPMAPARAQTPPPAAEAQVAVPVAPAGQASLEGRILRSDGKTPVEGAIVRACFLDTDQVVSSGPSDKKGEYVLVGLPEGFADLTIETADGAFAANEVVRFLPAKTKGADFVLTQFEERPPAWWQGRETRPAPCGGKDPTGAAEVRNRMSGGQFFHSKAGVAVLAGGAAVALLLLASGGDEPDASASTP
jgi:hypothetical protein